MVDPLFQYCDISTSIGVAGISTAISYAAKSVIHFLREWDFVHRDEKKAD